MDINKITMTCFAASYAVAFAAEVARLFFRAPIRTLVAQGMLAAGLFAHALYLYVLARREMAGGAVEPLSSWYDFCLLAAWVVAGAAMGLALRRRDNAVGIFLLPLVLALVALAAYVKDLSPFPTHTALSTWRVVHGVALLLGTVAVALGFATGIMYLIKSYQLKHKLPPRPGLKLPTLEWLQRFNREALAISSGLLAIGLVAGVVLNLIKGAADQHKVPWTDPVVISSAVLFAWLAAIVVFESCYRPARQGQKVAYLTLASFVFLALAIYFVVQGQHASERDLGQSAAGVARDTSSTIALLPAATPASRAMVDLGRGGRP